jgi:hypothetical protein
MLLTSFQLNRFNSVLLLSCFTLQGPLWPLTAWLTDASPGPPCSHSVSGAMSDNARDSKNQKKKLASYGWMAGSVVAGTVM